MQKVQMLRMQNIQMMPRMLSSLDVNVGESESLRTLETKGLSSQISSPSTYQCILRRAYDVVTVVLAHAVIIEVMCSLRRVPITMRCTSAAVVWCWRRAMCWRGASSKRDQALAYSKRTVMKVMLIGKMCGR